MPCRLLPPVCRTYIQCCSYPYHTPRSPVTIPLVTLPYVQPTARCIQQYTGSWRLPPGGRDPCHPRSRVNTAAHLTSSSYTEAPHPPYGTCGTRPLPLWRSCGPSNIWSPPTFSTVSFFFARHRGQPDKYLRRTFQLCSRGGEKRSGKEMGETGVEQ